MGGLFGGGATPAPIAPPAPPSRSDAEVQSAALAARQRRAQALGRTETIVSSGADEENTTTKTLLGTA
jgi:hypothetical protein